MQTKYKKMQSSELVSKPNICKICNGDLDSKPTIQLPCSHKCHKVCFVTLFTKTPISDMHPFIFKSKKCPECEQLVLNSEIPELKKESDEVNKFYTQIFKDARKRFVIKDFLPTPDFKWESLTEKDQQIYITTKVLYAKCSKCFNPYFARFMPNETEIINSPLTSENYICICCSKIGEVKCPTHGEEFVRRKCFFCCKPASVTCGPTFWSCEGHYQKHIAECECLDPRKCPLGINHPKNGEQTPFVIGCLKCRSIQKLD